MYKPTPSGNLGGDDRLDGGPGTHRAERHLIDAVLAVESFV
jgi:hypothetical protein